MRGNASQVHERMLDQLLQSMNPLHFVALIVDCLTNNKYQHRLRLVIFDRPFCRKTHSHLQEFVTFKSCSLVIFSFQMSTHGL